MMVVQVSTYVVVAAEESALESVRPADKGQYVNMLGETLSDYSIELLIGDRNLLRQSRGRVLTCSEQALCLTWCGSITLY